MTLGNRKDQINGPASVPVGVVIPVYNRRTILLETLPHVLKQTLQPTRLIIADDGSTDGTPDAAQEWLAEQRPAFEWRVLRLAKSTAADARKVATDHVTDLPAITYLDSDDHWPADFLERTTSQLFADSETVVACVDRNYVDLSGGVQASDCTQLVRNPVPWLFANGAGVASCTVLRTEAVLEAGGWRPELALGEDSWLFTHLGMLGTWSHAAGEPVTFNVGNAIDRNEENNLSRRHADADLHWVRIYEDLYETVCERRPDIDRAPLHAALAERWRRAAKSMLALGDAAEARKCLSCAIYWQPMAIKSWRRLAKAAIARNWVA